MTKTRLAARFGALILLGLSPAAFAQEEFVCRKRALYDYCGAVMVAATGQLMNEPGSQPVIDQLNGEFRSYFGEFKDLPVNEVIQKNVMLSALEHFSLDSVKACTGRSMELLEELVDLADRECREHQ